MTKEIILNGRQITYELQIKSVKNINLRIKADRTIFVSANPSISEPTIEEFLVSKSVPPGKKISGYVPRTAPGNGDFFYSSIL